MGSRFGPEFRENAAPEAIRASLIDLCRERATIDADIRKLENLLIHRTRQIQRGEWPTVEPGEDRHGE